MYVNVFSVIMLMCIVIIYDLWYYNPVCFSWTPWRYSIDPPYGDIKPTEVRKVGAVIMWLYAIQMSAPYRKNSMIWYMVSY